MRTDWSEWLTTRRHPLLLAFGGEWRDTTPLTLEAIRAELRALDALVVVAARDAVFALGPDDSPLPVPELDRRGFEALYRAIRVDPGDRYGQELTLTLLDERRQARMQSVWPGGEEPAAVLAYLLAWAGRSLLDTTTLASASGSRAALTFTRPELVVLSLIGALAAPIAAECRVHQVPASGPSDRPPSVAFALDRAPRGPVAEARPRRVFRAR